MKDASAPQSLSVESLMAAVADEFLERLNRGEQPDIEEYAARYPEIATFIRQMLPTLQLLRAPSGDLSSTGAEAEQAGLRGCLGDYRIVRELGRGGMGVVYEAEQISLGRRVALKVLPFAAALDSKQLQRFKNEAQAAAHLHHTNIVPVYGVGCERGVHYYAMQFIEGQTLAAVIRELRENAEGRMTNDEGMTNAKGQNRNGCTPDALAPTSIRHSTLGLLPPLGIGHSSFFRTVASLGIQAAEGLQHAHELGIVHRDIKPANLLMEWRAGAANPVLWITDFGLAHCKNQAGLTVSGDLLGTLRYMSPEQALGKRLLVDHRTDIYSLAVTLYELLTLEPAYSGRDREEVLQRIAFEEPRLPRQRNKAIPRELETIVLKAMEKCPEARYATAQELADDLRCFLDDKPIQARRPTFVQRAAKWCRRHKTVVWAGLVVALVIALVAGGNAVWWIQRRALADREVFVVLQEATHLQEQAKWPEASLAAQRAAGLSASGLVSTELQNRVHALQADLKMVETLERILLEQSTVKDGHFDQLGADSLYTEAFRNYGIDVDNLEAAEVGERIRTRPIRLELAAALDEWAHIRRRKMEKAGVLLNWKQLLAAARAADPDPWRDRFRELLEQSRPDKKVLQDLAAEAENAALPARTLYTLGCFLARDGSREAAVKVLRKAQQQYPDDFWINHDLAQHLFMLGQPVEALRFYSAALAIRPGSPGLYLNMGNAFEAKGDLEDAIAADKQAIHIKSNYAAAFHNLGTSLSEVGALGEAIAALKEAVRLRPNAPIAHYDLGIALEKKGAVDEAIAAFRESIRLKPDEAMAYFFWGKDYKRKGALDHGNAALTVRISFMSAEAPAYNHLGALLCDKKQDYDGAVDALREAIRLKPDYVEAYKRLGKALMYKGAWDGAIAAFEEAIRLKPQDPLAPHNNLGIALMRKGRIDEAVAEFRQSIRLRPELTAPHTNLGKALRSQGKMSEAEAEYRHAVSLWPNNAKVRQAFGRFLFDGKRDYDGAIVAFREAVRLVPDDPDCHFRLARAFARKGALDDAIATYKETIRLKPDFAEAVCNLGLALQRKGQFREALTALRRGHELGSRNPHWRYPSARWISECERFIKLDDSLPAILGGEKVPASPAERIEYAKLCVVKNRNAAGARFYQDAFAAQPDLANNLETGYRYDAACVAALVGCGRGEDAAMLEEKQRAAWRRQAQKWLRADLKIWAERAQSASPQARALVQARLDNWRHDSDLSGVRGETALATLPAAERDAWRKLWTDVQATLARAQARTVPGNSNGPQR